MPRFVESAPWGIRKNLAYVDGFHSTPEFEYHVTTNSQGFRGQREYDETPPPETLRIAVLGDSVALGHGVADGETFSVRLEEMLGARGAKAEVINMGVSGFGTAEELIQLRHHTLKYHPHAVVLTYFQNDQVNNAVSGLYSLVNGKLVELSGNYQPGIFVRDRLSNVPGYDWLAQHSHLVNLARTMVSSWVLRRSVQAAFPDKDVRGAVGSSSSSEELTRKLLEQIVSEACEAGAQVILLDVPLKAAGAVDNFPSLDVPAPVVDAQPALAAAQASGAQVFFPVDGHPTAAGHQAIASALVDPLLNLTSGEGRTGCKSPSSRPR